MFEREYASVNRSSIAYHSDLEDIHALNYSRGPNAMVLGYALEHTIIWVVVGAIIHLNTILTDEPAVHTFQSVKPLTKRKFDFGISSVRVN